MEPKRCVGCFAVDRDKRLIKCVVCHQSFCHDCATFRSGRRFCSPGCSSEFFHGDIDPEDVDA